MFYLNYPSSLPFSPHYRQILDLLLQETLPDQKHHSIILLQPNYEETSALDVVPIQSDSDQVCFIEKPDLHMVWSCVVFKLSALMISVPLFSLRFKMTWKITCFMFDIVTRIRKLLYFDISAILLLWFTGAVYDCIIYSNKNTCFNFAEYYAVATR